MDYLDLGHQEQAKNLPREPLASHGIWSLGSWGLPAATLSFVSLAVFTVILVYLQSNAGRRALFRLPFDPLFLAVAGALLAWFVLYRCRGRPGRHFPRYWLLFLALLATVLVVVAPFSDLSLVHALVTATVAATLAVLPRLLRFRPNSRLIQGVSPLSLILVLLAILPAAGWVATRSIRLQTDRVDSLVERLRRAASEVGEVAAYDWSRFADAPGASAVQIERLAALSVPSGIRDAKVWEVAAVLGRDEELRAAAVQLLDSLVAAVDPAVTPKTSAVSEPAAWWDPVSLEWRASAGFPRWSAIAGSYHRELGRLLVEFEIGDAAAADNAWLQALDGAYQERRRAFQEALEPTLRSWSDHWMVFTMPRHAAPMGGADMPLAELLKMPLNRDENPLVPADLWGLLRLPLTRAKELNGKATGCHPRDYLFGPDEFHRLDCYAYAPASTGEGAELRVEMRLVYGRRGERSLTPNERPSEVFFLFPVPDGESSNAFRDAVMNELAAAVRGIWPGRLKTPDTSGSVTNGFELIDGGAALEVNRPTVDPYYGERNALVVRAEMKN